MTPDRTISDLAALSTNVSRRLVAHGQSRDAFNALTSLAVQLVPGAQYAGITQGNIGKFVTLAPTDDLVVLTDKVQYALSSGPCVDAALEDRVFRTGDLRVDPRWPEFGRRAYEVTGVLSMLAIRLYLEDDAEVIAGLNMYSTEVDAFTESDETLAVLLATHGTLAVAASTARERSVNLEVALSSRTEIGIAMGILMNQHRITRDESFAMLRIASQHSARKLADLATEVADTGMLTLPALARRKTSRA